MSAIHALRQPKPFYLIFFIELWERFGYYGMQALIVLYFVKQLSFTDTHADNLFGAFAALVFLLPSVGGYIGDRLLGTKRTIIFGTIVLILGYASLALNHGEDIYLSLAAIAVGVGLFKANPSSLLSKIYAGDETKLDGGFTLYYMAVNIGSFLSMALTPTLAAIFGWQFAFAVCAIGLAVALIIYLVWSGLVKPFGSKPDFEALNFKKLLLVVGITIALICVSSWLLYHYTLSGWIILCGGLVVLGIFISEITKASAKERRTLILCLILIIQAIIFFVLYMQMPMSLNLFAMRNVEHSLLGIPIEPASYQVFNSFWIIILSPILAIVYNQLAYRGKDLSIPGKFATGTFITGIGFMILPFAATFASHNGIISGGWLVAFYLFESVGELLVSALGLAMVSRYVPERLMGFTMGAWFLCSSIAGIIAGHVASLADIPQSITDPGQSLAIYSHVFRNIGIATLIIALVMTCFVPILKKLSPEH